MTGATVSIDHPIRGILVAVTDERGEAVFDLEEDMTFTATATTEWGHGADSTTFSPGDDGSIRFDLTRPAGLGLVTLTDGQHAEFLYRPRNSGTWTVLPSNYRGEASFVDRAGRYEVAKRCLANGDVEGERTVTVRWNRNRSTGIRGSCPA